MKTIFRYPLLGAAVVGFLIGTVIGGHSALLELLGRLRWAWGEGAGERADWGEPLFYFLLTGIPWGLLGSFIGLAVVVLAQWRLRTL